MICWLDIVLCDSIFITEDQEMCKRKHCIKVVWVWVYVCVEVECMLGGVGVCVHGGVHVCMQEVVCGCTVLSHPQAHTRTRSFQVISTQLLTPMFHFFATFFWFVVLI